MLFLVWLTGPPSGTVPAVERKVYQEGALDDATWRSINRLSPRLVQSRATTHGSLILQDLDDHRNSLAAADACRCQAITQTIAPQFVQNGNYEARTAGTERMPQRNRAAIHVGLVALQSQHF